MIPIIEDHRKRILKTVNRIATGIALMAVGMMFAVFAALALKGVNETLAILTKVKDVFI